MITELHGTVLSVAPDFAVVSVGGVGLQVHCTPATLARLRVGEPGRLTTALIVREDSLTLYGFADADERAVFDALQTASGVGPRLAQAVLGVLSPDAVRAAIADEDLATLTRVPGIGRKVAQRFVLELRDRLGSPERAAAGPPVRAGAGPSVSDEVRDGLLALGYSLREAEAALETALKTAQAAGAANSADRSHALHPAAAVDLQGPPDPSDAGALLRAALTAARRA